MADLTDAAVSDTASWPIQGTDSVWQRRQPLLTPLDLRQLHLFGIPLMSAFPDPITGLRQVMDDDLLQAYIERAIEQVEVDLDVVIMPLQVAERHQFDALRYKSFGYLVTERKPVSAVVDWGVVSTNGDRIYDIPTEWVERGYLHLGQLSVSPLIIQSSAGQLGGGGGTGTGAVFLANIENRLWMPGFWTVTYQCGFPDGEVPRIINDLVGTYVALEILSQLATTYAQQNSVSIGIDGLSQSTSQPGPQIFTVRIDELTKKRDRIANKIKTLFGAGLICGDV